MNVANIEVITKEQKELFNVLQKDREESARVLEKPSMVGVKKSLTEKYSESAHFLYELLQNADDAKATMARFILGNHGLIFAHDGTTHFSISDSKTEEEDKKNGRLGHINSITSIGNTTKFESQIGKFGIGFKAVFEYTNTPHVYDPPYMFKIERFIVPNLFENDHTERIEDETLFYLPFDLAKKKPEVAYQEINKRLQELDHTLLFLRNLEKIEWEGEQESSSTYLKLPSELENEGRVISLSKEINNQWSEQKFLIFDKKITDNEQIHVINVAYNLTLDEEQIVSPRKFPAYCFFTTREHTELKFIINAPFLLIDNREGVKEGQEWNSFLIKEAAALVAESLPKIKMMGLLGIDFLNVLPLSSDDLPEDHMFRPIYDAVLVKLKSNKKFLPANDGSYISAEQAFLARGRDLIDLLGTDQLSLLFGKQDAHWLDSNITENSPLWEYLTKKLEIQVVRPETFSNLLNEEFMKSQSDEWVIKFYEFLLKHQDLWEQSSSVLRKKPFIRLNDDTHVIPFHANGNPLACLPTDSTSDFPTVKQSIYDDPKAREFLVKLPLDRPDALFEVIDFLPKYNDPEADVPKEDNINHIKKIAKALQPESLDKSQDELLPKLKMLLRKTGLENLFNVLSRQGIPTTKLIQILKPRVFKEIPFIISTNKTAGKLSYKKPSDIYLPAAYTNDPSLEIFFEDNPDIWFLDELYSDIPEIKTIIEELNISIKPKIITEEFKTNKKYIQRFTKDYKMEGLEFIFENRSLDLNIPLYLWSLLIFSQKDESYKIEFQGTLESSNNKTFPVKSTKKENKVATILNLLNQNQWLPDKNGNFHKPPEILLSELPDDFEKEISEAKSLADKLGFKKDIEQELLSKLPPEKRKIYELVNSSSEEDIQAIKQLLKERKKKSQFPEGKAPNKTRREKKAKENYVSSKKKKSEKKERLVRITQDQIDKRTSLREWYQDDEEKVVCQVCKSPPHFKNRQGKYYFEAIEIVKDEKEYDANALALCPLCAAKYLYGEKTEDTEIKQKLIKLYNDFNNGSLNQNELKITISLCSKTADIQFVEKHLIDLSPIFDENQNDE
jgi:hypothetical protein